MRLELRNATSIKRNDDGLPFSWRLGGIIASFDRPQYFKQYVEHNAASLKDAIVFTGNAQLLLSANSFLVSELKRVEAL